MEKEKTVEAYLTKNENWRNELEKLRAILLRTELTEAIKWGIPTYMAHGKKILAMGAFKHHVALWFHNGVFLKDEKNVLINANEEKTRGLRQWRFASADEIDADLVYRYVLEAIQNQKEGKEIKPESKKISMPVELKEALDTDKELKSEFFALSPGKQKEYAEFIGSAKQESTRNTRLEKCKPIILTSKGLHEKYRK
ncbi:hypothetical protein G3O08_03785 [Cryomorpha ignava]|uniref:YdhG-like domain-containing protein n=1 Tax=Cryomorpha ignava TaxID=101383 RepID=A0A7K3WPE2_9FLAO|nr:DUF1801 domain-containing protein [Cryomorpha ignava]NEN22625.1 hypothetical protein [Cryomorpha ignava]